MSQVQSVDPIARIRMIYWYALACFSATLENNMSSGPPVRVDWNEAEAGPFPTKDEIEAILTTIERRNRGEKV